MCQWGDTVTLKVRIPASHSHTRKTRWAYKPIDRCLAPIVKALNRSKIYTVNCCCGHGKTQGSIVLADGRELIVSKS